jgi:Family of unknown function (DUF6256)
MVAQPMTWTDLLRHDVIPVLTGYLVFLAIVVSYGLHRRAGKAPIKRGGGADYAWRPLARYLAGVVAGGYIFFLTVVVLFYFVIGEKSGTFISQALIQGSAFTFGIVLPAFVALTVAEEAWRRLRRRRRPGV